MPLCGRVLLPSTPPIQTYHLTFLAHPHACKYPDEKLACALPPRLIQMHPEALASGLNMECAHTTKLLPFVPVLAEHTIELPKQQSFALRKRSGCWNHPALLGLSIPCIQHKLSLVWHPLAHSTQRTAFDSFK
uniref:Uncharacterized protein n=1 Tax=Eutreptiella gymnastica TaxID=73025 RepID=A0A7S1N0N5_9EUGL